MELVAAGTLWGLFSAWLLFPRLGVPRILVTAAAMLIWLEFVALLAWGYASEDCARRPCNAVAEVARTAASVDLPALSVTVVVLAVAYAVRRRRRGSVAPVSATPEAGAPGRRSCTGS